MRALAIPILLLAFSAGCDRATGKLEDLSYGSEFEGDYEAVMERAVFVLKKHYRYGLDPDLSDQKAGELWTVWDYRMSSWYRDSQRERAHIKIEKLEDGRLRIGVAVVHQTNDNIDNPGVKEEARWVRSTRNAEKGVALEQEIVRRYVKEFTTSKHFEEKYRTEKRKGMREDILDRNKDVNLEDLDDPDKKSVPSYTDSSKNKGKKDPNDPW